MHCGLFPCRWHYCLWIGNSKPFYLPWCRADGDSFGAVVGTETGKSAAFWQANFDVCGVDLPSQRETVETQSVSHGKHLDTEWAMVKQSIGPKEFSVLSAHTPWSQHRWVLPGVCASASLRHAKDGGRFPVLFLKSVQPWHQHLTNVLPCVHPHKAWILSKALAKVHCSRAEILQMGS